MQSVFYSVPYTCSSNKFQILHKHLSFFLRFVQLGSFFKFTFTGFSYIVLTENCHHQQPINSAIGFTT